MNVHKQRTAIARRLRQILPQDHMIVVAPDHPLLLRSPDLLVAGAGRLLAIMCGSALEIRRPRLAKARLALARAALPPETVFGFVTIASTDDLGHSLSSNLDEVVGLRDAATLTKVVPDEVSSGRGKARVEARSKTMARFGSNYRIAQLLARMRGDAKEPARMRPRGSRKVQYEGAVQGVAKAELLGEVVAADMVDLAFVGAARTFDLQEGVAWPSNSGGIAYLRSFPETRGDPEHYARANAFAGWVLSPARLESEHARLSHLLRMAGEHQ